MHKLLAILLTLLLGAGAMAQTITFATSAQPDGLDPQMTSATSAFQVSKSIYDTLVEVDRQGEIVPSLAHAWAVSEDGLVWTFQLVEGVRFHDGSVLDAEDVVASIDRIRAEANASPKREEYLTITAVSAPDPLTVRIELSDSTPALLATLASGWGAVLPAERIAAGHDFANDPIGSGPFRLGSWVRDSHIDLQRFDGYFRGAPAIDGVRIQLVTDGAVALQGLISGALDIAGVATADLPAVRANAGLNLVEAPSTTVLVAGLNTRRPYLDDPRVRQALNLAVDKRVVLDVAYGGGDLTGSFMETASPWYPADVQPYPYDPERARQLLAEAGVPADWTLDLVLPQPYAAHVQAGQIIQSMLAEVGVRSEIRIVEWGVWLSDTYGGARDFDITVIGHTGKLDPTGRFGGYGDGRTYTGHSNPEVVALLADGASNPELEARRAAYAQVLRHLHQDAPFIYFGTSTINYAHRANLSGYWLTPVLETFDFREVRVD